MDNSYQSNSNLSDKNTNGISFSAKLKRLKIEETILLQSIGKSINVGKDNENETIITNFAIFAEFKAFEAKLNSMLGAVKHAFGDLKSSISSNAVLESVDIDDIKKCTLELENSIKCLKSFINKELTALKLVEQKLNNKTNENPELIFKFKRQPRMQTATFNEIVPSPVKSLMNSALKCSEVQEFEDFMAKSPNRYGGWNEYYHNIFVNHWIKHFASQSNTFVEGTESSVEISELFPVFLREIQNKIQDISEDKIVAHVRWYSKYLYLKQRKQRAIDKWRSNRQIMRSAKAKCAVRVNSSAGSKFCDKRRCPKVIDSGLLENDDGSTLQSTTQNRIRFVRPCYNEEFKLDNLRNKRKEENDEKVLNFLKSTTQWKLKCASKEDNNVDPIIDIENIMKLHIPAWRVGI